MRWTLLILALLTLRCAPTYHPAVALPAVTLPSAILRVSVSEDFTPAERSLITTAAVLLNEQTHGRLYVSLSFGTSESEWRLERSDAASDEVAKFDMHFGHSVLGVCDRTLKTMYLIYARFDTNAEFAHVVMHEMAHAFGLEHVSDKRAIMYPSAGADAGLLMQPDDMLAMCEAIKC